MAKRKKSFSESIQEVEQVIQKIENNELEVDALFEQVKKSSDIISDCKSVIYKSDAELKKFFEELDN